MRKYNIIVTLTFILLFVGAVVGMISAMTPTASNDESGETVTETAAENGVATIEGAVFEPIETEAEETVAEKDSADNAPKMDDETPETAQNVSESDFDAVYSDEDLLYLAKIVQNEAGSDFCSDAHQRAVASVVLNRVANPRFPDSIIGVITQGWNGECALQYAVGGWERFNALEPSERAIENARYVLEHGVTVEGAIWQAEFIQGEIVAEFAYPAVYDTVTYICK